MPLHPVILAGGSGSRLWPLSREFYPKPFLTVAGPNSMLQATILRLRACQADRQATLIHYPGANRTEYGARPGAGRADTGLAN